MTMEPFQITVPPSLVPPAWKTNWNIFAGRTIYPDIQFESLICLSLVPDFVMDFGWALRDKGIVYSLQINHGHFGLSDVVFFGSFASITDAVATLQNWLDRLAAQSVWPLCGDEVYGS